MARARGLFSGEAAKGADAQASGTRVRAHTNAKPRIPHNVSAIIARKKDNTRGSTVCLCVLFLGRRGGRALAWGEHQPRAAVHSHV